MRRPSTASSALVLVLAAASSARAADFAQPGPYAFTESQPPTGLLPGVSDISVITPNQAGQYPLVIATHGWSAGRVNQVGWAKHMASYGYVVIVPGMPNPIAPDQAVWSANIRTLATNAVNASLFPQLAAKIDATKIVYEGFSAGGLASTLAAKDKAPNLLVLLDPVDNQQNLGATAIRSVCSPVLNFFTQPSACNNQMGWSTFASNGTGPLVRVGIKASTHCDGEDEARALCGTFCGGAAKTTNRDTIRKYMVAYLEWKLRGSTEAAALFTASALAGNAALESTSVVDRPGCGATPPPPADAGAPSVDAGTSPSVDAGTPPVVDAGGASSADAGVTPSADAGPDASGTAEGGCACSTTKASSFSPLALMVGLVPFLRRRKRS
jgi:MYXO-CTERM domain-containing protein